MLAQSMNVSFCDEAKNRIVRGAKLKHKLARLFLIIPFILNANAVLTILCLFFLDMGVIWNVFERFCLWLLLYGWLPALIMAILCIVFSASLKKPNSKKYIILSCFNIAVALVYMYFSHLCLMFLALSNSTIC